jgi:ComF family protein
VFIQLKHFLLDLIFPIRCIGCGTEGSWFCETCTERVKLKTEQNCPVCWQVSPGGQTCGNCKNKTDLAGLRVAASYEANPELARAVKTLKYKFSDPLATNLGSLLVRAIQTKQNYPGERILVPVPLHPRRKNWRGFNQAELLARTAAEKLNLPVENILLRTKNTPQQARLSRTARLINLKDAFAIQPETNLQNKTVILIDDVASTGATLGECASALRKAGAKSVWGLVLARG